MMNTFLLCRFSLANQSPGGPPAAWQGPDLKISKTEFRNTFRGVLFQWFGKLQNECCTTAGYLAEAFRGAIEAIPKGHLEAASSRGMSARHAFIRITLPQVLLDAAPSIGNQFTVIVKSSALVSVIAVPDLRFQSQKLVNKWYQPIEILTATAAIYIVFIFWCRWG